MKHQVLRGLVPGMGRAVVALHVAAASSALGGQLAPPPGPVEPTMKSLDQIEPRRCVNELPGDASAVHVITEPGRYFMTGDITGETGKHGIEIRLTDNGGINRVSIDMRGFSLIGVPGSLNGIHAQNQTSARWWVKKKMAKAEVSAVSGWGGHGVFVEGAEVLGISNLRVVDNSGDGVRYIAPGEPVGGINVSLEQIVSADNGGDGAHVSTQGTFVAETMVEVNYTGFSGSTNGGHGIFVELVDSAQSSVSVEGSSASGNAGDGVHLRTEEVTLNFQKVEFKYKASSASGNGGSGFVYDLADGMQGLVSQEDCTAIGNGGSGASARLGNTETLEFHVVRCEYKEGAIDGYGLTAGSDCDVYLRCASSSFSSNGDPTTGVGDGLRVVVGDNSVLTSVVDRVAALGNAGSGVHVEPSAMSTFSDVRVIDSDASGNGLDGVHAMRSATEIRGSRASRNGRNGYLVVEVEAALIKSWAIDNGDDGFDVSAGSAVVSGCVSAGNTGDGFQFAPGEPVSGINVSLEQIVGTGNGGNGGSISGGDADIRDGSFTSNALGGLDVNGSTLTVSGSTISDNGGDGLAITDSPRVRVVDTALDGNTGNGVTVGSSMAGLIGGPVTIRRCSMAGNTGSGCSIADAAGGHIEGNTAFSNGLFGIEVLSAGHLIVGNATGANPGGGVAANAASTAGPAPGPAVISGDNNFANPNP